MFINMKGEQNISKIPYLKCKVKEHEGEPLNLVCIGCKDTGLLCSLCSESHRNHRIIPLKILIHNLKNLLTKAPDDAQYCSKMEEIQNTKNSMLFELKCCVQSLAFQFQKLEEDIISNYNEVKMQIIDQIQLGLEIDQVIASVVAGTINSQTYIDNIKKLAQYVQPKDNQYILKMEFDRILIPFKERQSSLPKKLKMIEEDIQQILKHKNPTSNLIKKVENSPLVPEIIPSAFKYKFSSTLKPASISLNDKKTIAKQTQTSSTRFILIEDGIGLKNRVIRFKVSQLKNWIGVGVCLKDKMEAVNYNFKYQTLGHGSYLLSNNGYTWSHSRVEDNIHSCGVSFKQDSTVQLTLTPSQLIFKISDSPNPFKLKIQYKEEEWPHVCFCVNLCSMDDSVEILDI